MVSSEFRLEARKKLSGKWGKAVCVTLAYFAFSFVLNLILENTTGFANSVITILSSLIEIPLSFGLVICFVKLFNDENVNAFSFFSFGFDNFGKAWKISLRTTLKLILPIILLIISIVLFVSSTSYAEYLIMDDEGISVAVCGLIAFVSLILYFSSIIWLVVKSYYYEMAYMIAAENPEMSSKDIVNKSRELMQNNRLKLFCLEFSFFGWAILAVLSLGIGMLWLTPYMQFAKVSFYKYLIKD